MTIEKTAASIIEEAQNRLSELYGRPIILIEKFQELKQHPDKVADIVEKVTGVCMKSIEGESRAFKIKAARQLLCYYLAKASGFTHHQIAYVIKRDRSTVHNSIKKIVDMKFCNDIEYMDFISRIETKLSA